MYLMIIILPLISFIFSNCYGCYFDRLSINVLSVFSLLLCWLLSLFIFYEVILCGSNASFILYNWCLLNIYNISFGCLFDSLSSIMIVIITSISMLVHLYSIDYMEHDPSLPRFLGLLSLFTFFMLFLVTAGNFIQMFIGWEGVGVCSYLLINFWFTRILANKAALKAMIINRIADVFFCIAFLLILLLYKTVDYITVFNLIPFFLNDEIIFLNIHFKIITLINICLLIGAFGKSAQIGFHIWLADAMEGPTPVSSLLHAATMVTAGIFIVIRCSYFIEYSDNLLYLLTIIGGLTAIFGGLVASFQFDVKKIIAYSTCSQLGYMFFSCGLSNYLVAIYHLFNHAFFKALLFLSAGSIIHSTFDEQDMRRMGQLREVLPFTYNCFLLASLAIMGFPFLTGFYSKDLILEFAYSRFVIDSLFIYFLGFTSAIFTSIYSIRLIFYVFSHKKRTNTFFTFFYNYTYNIVECPWKMFTSMFILSFASIFIGFIFSDLMVGLGNLSWGTSIFILPIHFSFINTEFVHPLIKNLPVIFSLFFFYLTWFIINYTSCWSKASITLNIYYIVIYYPLWYILASFSYSAGFFNNLYHYIFFRLYNISYVSINKNLDKGIFELVGPFGFYKFFYNLHKDFKNSWPLLIFLSIFFIFVFLSLLVFIVILPQNIFAYPGIIGCVVLTALLKSTNK